MDTSILTEPIAPESLSYESLIQAFDYLNASYVKSTNHTGVITLDLKEDQLHFTFYIRDGWAQAHILHTDPETRASIGFYFSHKIALGLYIDLV